MDENFRKVLRHYGIVGQKWGVKHGPPYPLDTKISGQITKKAEEKQEHQHSPTGDQTTMKSGAGQHVALAVLNACALNPIGLVVESASIAKSLDAVKKKGIIFERKRWRRSR